jgi:hypothetical protein
VSDGAVEFPALIKSKVVIVGVAVLAALSAVAAYVHSNAPPACNSEAAEAMVYDKLHNQFHLDSVFLNNIRTLAGGYFGDSQDCSAEVTEIRGNIDASQMPWREIRYRIERQDAAPGFAIAMTVGGNVPLAEPPPSFWTRLLGRL